MKVNEKGINISLSQSAKEYIAAFSYDVTYGARPIKRALYEIIEDQLADFILEDKIKIGSNVHFDCINNTIKAEIS